MTAERGWRRPADYEIRVRGHLGTTILRAFPALHAETRGGDTLLRGAALDQAALYGALAQAEALGLELLEVRRLPAAAAARPDEPCRMM
jgi:hypothetical protein